jgi:hypothetical protein
VLTVKVAVVAFAATVTLEGTVAAAVLLLLNATTAPLVGAGPLNVTVPVEGAPPATAVGFRLTPLGTGGVTPKLAVCVVLLYVAEMVADVLLATGLVLTVKVAVVAFGATVTLAGTVATAVLLLASATTTPPAAAEPFSVTVPVDEVPPVTVVGLRLTPVGTRGVTVNPAFCVVLL